MQRLRFDVLGYAEENKTDGTFPVVGSLVWDMHKEKTIKLGRHHEENFEKNSMLFKRKVVSRRHAKIWKGEKGKIYIQDMGSSCGTFLNSQRLSPSQKISEPVELKDEDVLRIGSDFHGGLKEQCRSVVLNVNIKNLVELNKYSADDCCICLSDITNGQAIFVTPCCHILHYKCGRSLLAAPVFRCPLCRKTMNLYNEK